MEVDKGNILISRKLAEELGIKEEAEISVKGKRIRVKVIIQEAIPYIEVWANASDMHELGIEDNSTVTLRAIK
jgi:anaerobic selenocysteine-containing dehydrogenase